MCRLVRGSGEIIEEIVSKEQQKNINKVCYVITCSKSVNSSMMCRSDIPSLSVQLATMGDSMSFQQGLRKL